MDSLTVSEHSEQVLVPEEKQVVQVVHCELQEVKLELAVECSEPCLKRFAAVLQEAEVSVG